MIGTNLNAVICMQYAFVYKLIIHKKFPSKAFNIPISFRKIHLCMFPGYGRMRKKIAILSWVTSQDEFC